MSKKQQVVWISKYALSTGIYEARGHFNEDDPKYFWEKTENGLGATFGPTHWHRTRKEAVAVASKLKAKKIVSLKKQLAKIRALKFE